MNLKKLVTVVLMLSALAGPVSAQQVLEEIRYNNGKVLLGQKKYELAMAELLPLTSNTSTPYGAQASYFYALAAFKTNKLQEATQILQQLKDKHSQWANMPEARYLLANVLFERQDYDRALAELAQLSASALTNDAESLKRYYLARITDRRQLEELVNRYPDDKTVAQVFADKLISSWYKPEDRSTLERLVSRHNLDRDQYLNAASKRKQGYNIATLLPFQLNQDLSQSVRKNMLVNDMYAGMQLAQESLRQEGVQINLFAYDAGSDTTAVKRILNTPDLRQMDLVIGPVYRSTSKVAARFAREANVPVINPLSQDIEIAENTPNVYLFESSVATQARQAATYAFNTFSPKTAIIVSESSKEDTTFAYHYRQQFIKLGGKVRSYRKINSAQAQATASVFKGLTLTDLGHIAVFSDKMTAAVNATSLLQGKAPKLPLVTYEKWLEINQITLQQLDALEVYFISPKFIAKDSDAYKNFRNQYITRYNMPPSAYANAGFEMVYFYGSLLQQYGTNLNQALAEARIKPGTIYSGVGYTNAAARNEVRPDNQHVPITKLENQQLVVVNPVY